MPIRIKMEEFPKKDNTELSVGRRDSDLFPSTFHIGSLTDDNKELRRKIFDLYTIFEISRHLNSMLSVDSLLDAILYTCIGQMGVSGAVIVVQDPTHANKLSHCHVKGMSLDHDSSIEFSRVGPLVRYIQRKAKPMFFEEIHKNLPNDSEDLSKLQKAEAELIVPLIVKGNLLGILILPKRLSGVSYHENDLEFVSILVNQLSVAIINADLYESEKRALIELQMAQKRLIESERLAALGRLSASIAHEVNNPLGIIKNYLAILANYVDGNEQISNNLVIVQEEVDRIARIVRQLLDFYRPVLESPVSLDILETLDATIELVSGKLNNSGIEINKEYERNPMSITGSSERLRQVFLNLLLNARDAMPKGGKLIISLRANDGFAEIAFADSGSGISENDLPNIFEPFYTTKKDSGTGLGLAVCYGIIRSHHGFITAGNNPDGGAIFTIKLPIRVENER